MERSLGRVLLTFATGFALIGLVIGFITTNTGDFCGSLFNHNSGCSQPASMMAALVVCWGLALTCVVAAVAADPQPSKHPAGRSSDVIDEPPGQGGDNPQA